MSEATTRMQRGEFLKHYGNLIANLWETPTLLNTLQADPAGVLARFGLTVPSDAHIELTIQPAEAVDEASLPDAQYGMWTQGFETNHYSLVVTRCPLDFDEDLGIPLPDEVLELVAGGNIQDIPACCPCCSCEDVTN